MAYAAIGVFHGKESLHIAAVERAPESSRDNTIPESS